MRLDDVDDAGLLAVVDHRAEAFAALYRRYEVPVLAYLLRRVPSSDVAADLLVEVFAAALGELRAGNGPRGRVVAWLFGIARHKVADSYRRGSVEDAARRRLAMQPIALHDEDLERIDALRGPPELLGWLDALPADERHAVTARVLEERPYAKIAGALRCSEQVLRKRVSRGLARLRARWEQAS